MDIERDIHSDGHRERDTLRWTYRETYTQMDIQRDIRSDGHREIHGHACIRTYRQTGVHRYKRQTSSTAVTSSPSEAVAVRGTVAVVCDCLFSLDHDPFE